MVETLQSVMSWFSRLPSRWDGEKVRPALDYLDKLGYGEPPPPPHPPNKAFQDRLALFVIIGGG